MQFLIYILVYPFLWLISILPFKLLYLVSDCVYILLYYIIGYRKKVVLENLKLVFPEKSEKQIKSIRKKFYKHLSDVFLEMAKTMTISEKELKQRFKVLNPEELHRLENLNKSIIMMCGHYASWEWSLIVDSYSSYRGLAVYKKLANKHFDTLIKNIRSKFGTTLISTKETVTVINGGESEGVKSLMGFISDQSPRLTKEVYWNTFMGINVPCFTGAERLAKKLNLTTAYLKINKVGRGFYEAEIITLAVNPNDYPNYKLTDMFLHEVEKQIHEVPEYYFWTHKRWKHRGKEAK